VVRVRDDHVIAILVNCCVDRAGLAAYADLHRLICSVGTRDRAVLAASTCV
jgi:hypothetical protein